MTQQIGAVWSDLDFEDCISVYEFPEWLSSLPLIWKDCLLYTSDAADE